MPNIQTYLIDHTCNRPGSTEIIRYKHVVDRCIVFAVVVMSRHPMRQVRGAASCSGQEHGGPEAHHASSCMRCCHLFCGQALSLRKDAPAEGLDRGQGPPC